MEIERNKTNRNSSVKVEKFEDCFKISVNDEVNKSELKNLIDNCILNGLDSSLEAGTYYYFKRQTESALYVLLGDRTRMFLNKNGALTSLIVNEKSCYYVFSSDDKNVDSYSSAEDKQECYSKILEFISVYGKVVGDIFLNDLPYLCISSRIYVPSTFVKVIEKDGIALVRVKNAYCGEESFHYHIVDKRINSIVGNISMDLSKSGDDNFRYCGNVSYDVFLGYRHNGYATNALILLKECTKRLDDSYNKDLYISTLVDNVYSQQAALKSGATLYMDTDVPKSDSLSFIGKVDHVLIYKL